MAAYSTAEVAELIGVSKNTLLRWISEGRLSDVSRDWRNWRVWSEADLARASAVRDGLHGTDSGAPDKREAEEYARDLLGLGESRGFRRAQPEDEPPFKVADMNEYADDLTRLGEGRAYRAS